MWRKFGEFESGTNFLAWALRIADYQVMRHRTKQARLMAFSARLREAMMGDVAGRDADEAAAGLTALSGCMDRLAPADREMVTLCYGESVPVRRIADSLGRSPSSIHHSLCRIRKWLLGCVRRELRREDLPDRFAQGVLDGEEQP